MERIWLHKKLDAKLSHSKELANDLTIAHIRSMVERTIRFFRNEHVVGVEFGEKPKLELQLLMYWIMSQHAKSESDFESIEIEKIGFYNPRRDESYILQVDDIDEKEKAK